MLPCSTCGLALSPSLLCSDVNLASGKMAQIWAVTALTRAACCGVAAAQYGVLDFPHVMPTHVPKISASLDCRVLSRLSTGKVMERMSRYSVGASSGELSQ